MPQKFDDDIHIPDEDMKMPESASHNDGAHTHNLANHLLLILLGASGLVLIVLVGLYIYDTYLPTEEATVTIPDRPTAAENQEPESSTARAQVETMQALSPSDSIEAIITDLENTDLGNIDEEATIIDAELE